MTRKMRKSSTPARVFRFPSSTGWPAVSSRLCCLQRRVYVTAGLRLQRLPEPRERNGSRGLPSCRGHTCCHRRGVVRDVGEACGQAAKAGRSVGGAGPPSVFEGRHRVVADLDAGESFRAGSENNGVRSRMCRLVAAGSQAPPKKTVRPSLKLSCRKLRGKTLG